MRLESFKWRQSGVRNKPSGCWRIWRFCPIASVIFPFSSMGNIHQEWLIGLWSQLEVNGAKSARIVSPPYLLSTYTIITTYGNVHRVFSFCVGFSGLRIGWEMPCTGWEKKSSFETRTLFGYVSVALLIRLLRFIWDVCFISAEPNNEFKWWLRILKQLL